MKTWRQLLVLAATLALAAAVLGASALPAGASADEIQAAVDALPASGGVVTLQPGDYALSGSIRLRSRVTLRGSGPATRLHRRDPAVEVLLREDAAAGARRVRVADAGGFAVGHAVTVHSKEADGWRANSAVVQAIEGDWLVLDRELSYACLRAEGARANNFFAGITAQDGRDIRIEDLTLAGGLAPGAEFVQEFVVSAVHLVRVRDAVVARVQVHAWPGDGISIQGGDNALVTGCLVEGCVGHGFHPGSDVASGEWSGNVARDNGEDGFYFCHNVRHTVVSGSRFYRNGRHGIGGLGAGGDGGDRHNVVMGNICWENGRAGIEIRGGSDNAIAHNVCRNNSRSRPGRWPGILVQGAVRTSLMGNHCIDDQEAASRTQGWGIEIAGTGESLELHGNVTHGNLAGGVSRPTVPTPVR